MLRASLFALLCLVPCGLPAVIIDDFSVSQPLTATPTFVQDPSILGGEREYFLGISTGVTLEVSGGVATFTAPASGTGTYFGSLYWDGAEGDPNTVDAGLGGIDLTDGGLADRFVIDILSITGGQIGVSLLFADTNGLQRGLFGFQVTATPRVISFAGANPPGSTPRDLTSIARVGLSFQLTPGQSVSVDRIYTGTSQGPTSPPPSAVPEPSTAGLLTAGLALLAWRRRRTPPPPSV